MADATTKKDPAEKDVAAADGWDADCTVCGQPAGVHSGAEGHPGPGCPGYSTDDQETRDKAQEAAVKAEAK